MSEYDPALDEDDDVNEDAQKFMFVNRKAPYGSIHMHELQEMMLICGAYEQDVTAVFMDDGVYAIKKGQQGAALNMKHFSPTYRALDGYDIEKLYVEKESMEARGLTPDDFLVDIEIKTAAEIGALMEEQDVILTA